MNISEYEFTPPGGAGGRQLDGLAARHGGRAERLVGALEAFVTRNTAYSDLVAPAQREPRGDVEVFCVPSRSVLAEMPDAAALVCVDHRRRTVELISVVEAYGEPGSGSDWKFREFAAALVAPDGRSVQVD